MSKPDKQLHLRSSKLDEQATNSLVQTFLQSFSGIAIVSFLSLSIVVCSVFSFTSYIKQFINLLFQNKNFVVLNFDF